MQPYARQGEVTIFRLPDDTPMPDWPALEHEAGHLIIGHSETGHHHVIERPEAVRAVVKPGTGAMTIIRLLVEDPTRAIHLRAYDTHTPVDLPPGKYEARGQQEYDPYAEALRRAAD
jgi:hypothetical protein